MTSDAEDKDNSASRRPAVHILDVGHGNTTLVTGDGSTTLIDIAPSVTVLTVLREWTIQQIDEVLISHSDEDHVGGLIQLLMQLDVRLGTVYANTDTLQRSSKWRSVRMALGDARKRGVAKVRPDLSRGVAIGTGHSVFTLEVLSPAGEDALGGPGETDSRNRVMNTNTLSSVVRVLVAKKPLVLLAGDIDRKGLDQLLENEPHPTAPILVFPHHGGLPGGRDAREFAQRLTQAVDPKVVIFSLGRRFKNPLPDIVAGVRAGANHARIMCTQLSTRCAPSRRLIPPRTSSIYLAAGAANGECCAGNISIFPTKTSYDITPSIADHSLVIDREATTPLCRMEFR